MGPGFPVISKLLKSFIFSKSRNDQKFSALNKKSYFTCPSDS